MVKTHGVYTCAQQAYSKMGNSRSSEVIVTDTMSEDNSESFNVVNIHSPTAGLGFSLALGITFIFLSYKVYRRCSASWPCMPRREEKRPVRREPRAPAISTTSLNMDMPGLHLPVTGEALKCWECQNHAWVPAPRMYGDDFYPSQAVPTKKP